MNGPPKNSSLLCVSKAQGIDNIESAKVGGTQILRLPNAAMAGHKPGEMQSGKYGGIVMYHYYFHTEKDFGNYPHDQQLISETRLTVQEIVNFHNELGYDYVGQAFIAE